MSLVHVSIVIPLVIQCLDSPVLSADRAFDWDERAGTAFAIAAGYFLWDTIDMIMHFEAIGFVAHGSCRPHDIRAMYTLTEANHRHGVFLRVLFIFRKPGRSLRKGWLCLTCLQRPFLAYYGVRCLLWEG